MSALASELVLIGRELLAAILIAATLFVLGRLPIRRFAFSDLFEEVSTSIALGLGLAGTLLFALGALHLLYAGAIWGGVLAIHVLGWRVWRGLLGRPRSSLAEASGSPIALLPLVVVAIPAFALALYPPTGFDETLYHLPFARAFALDHGLVLVPTLRFPIFPQLAEILSAALLIVGDDLSTHVPSWIALVATGLALASWARRRAGPQAGIWAAALWLGNPLAAYLAGSGYVDLQMTLFAALAWIHWERWSETERTRDLLLAGAFAGFSAATKYVGLLVVVILTIAAALRCIRRRQLPAFLTFAGMSLGALVPWYARNLIETGNPVFPFLPDLFGPNAWMTSADLSTWQQGPRNIPVSLSAYALGRLRETVFHPSAVLLWPWRAAFEPSRFNHQAPLSPWFPIAVPLALAGALWDRRLRGVAIFSIVFFFLSSTHDPRLLLPADALICGAAAVALGRIAGADLKRSSVAVAGLALLLAVPGAAYASYRIARHGVVPSSLETRSRFLAEELPGYALLDELNRRKGNAYTIYALYHENLAYYADGRFLGDWVGPYRFQRVLGRLDSGAGLAQELQDMGAGYFLVDAARLPPALTRDEAFRSRFRKTAVAGPVVLYERCERNCGNSAR